MHPLIIAALISGGASLLGKAIPGGKGQPTEMTSADPQMDKYRQQLMQMAMQRMGQPQPYAQVNPMNMMGANMASQYYYGQPYTHPGYGMGTPGGGMPQGQAPPTGSGGPQMGMPMNIPGAPGQGMPYGQMPPGLSKGANFAR
jgi:hypothetical protein